MAKSFSVRKMGVKEKKIDTTSTIPVAASNYLLFLSKKVKEKYCTLLILLKLFLKFLKIKTIIIKNTIKIEKKYDLNIPLIV